MPELLWDWDAAEPEETAGMVLCGEEAGVSGWEDTDDSLEETWEETTDPGTEDEAGVCAQLLRRNKVVAMAMERILIFMKGLLSAICFSLILLSCII